MATLFDLERTAKRLGIIGNDNSKPFLCCKRCGEYIYIPSHKLAVELKKLAPQCACHLCGGTELLFCSKEPSRAFQLELRTELVTVQAARIAELELSLGLKGQAAAAPLPVTQERAALTEFDSLLGKPVVAKAEGLKLGE